MFTWLNKQGVVSDSGFILQFVDRFIAEYKEGVNTMKIEIEDGFINGKPTINVSHTAFAKWTGNGEPVQAEDQKRIAENFRLACEFQGLSVVFD